MKEVKHFIIRSLMKAFFLLCFVIIIVFATDVFEDWKMNRYIKKEKEKHKYDVPTTVTRGIHYKPDTIKRDTIE